MLRYASSRYATPCYATLRHATLRNATLRYEPRSTRPALSSLHYAARLDVLRRSRPPLLPVLCPVLGNAAGPPRCQSLPCKRERVRLSPRLWAGRLLGCGLFVGGHDSITFFPYWVLRVSGWLLTYFYADLRRGSATAPTTTFTLAFGACYLGGRGNGFTSSRIHPTHLSPYGTNISPRLCQRTSTFCAGG